MNLSQFRSKSVFLIIFLGFFCIAVLGTYVFAAAPPRDFPSQSIITIESGLGLYELAERLDETGVIRSPFWFRTAAIMLGGERGMQAGEYYMPYPQNTFAIAWRIVHGEHRIQTLKLTIPEGYSTQKISALFDERFPFFDNAAFEADAPEGYLFPDTYFVQVNVTASSTIRMMRDNFIRKIFDVMPEVEESGRSLEEIITMASIIENEANNQEDREIVSGILWKRYNIGMPLQVDASFSYVNGKTTEELTLDDLEIESPYNTYLYKGLPPTPISNPGLESIQAAIHPTTTPYLYFLTGKDGKMYYARNFDEHVQNKQKYLNGR